MSARTSHDAHGVGFARSRGSTFRRTLIVLSKAELKSTPWPTLGSVIIDPLTPRTATAANQADSARVGKESVMVTTRAARGTPPAARTRCRGSGRGPLCAGSPPLRATRDLSYEPDGQPQNAHWFS